MKKVLLLLFLLLPLSVRAQDSGRPNVLFLAVDDMNDWIGCLGVENDSLRREYMQAYHACVSFIDALLQLVFDALEESGHREDTIVLFTSDHGYHLGDHFLWGKVTLFRHRREGAFHRTRRIQAEDHEWCAKRGIETLPVLFPGFSWRNLKGEGESGISRHGGKFFWKQFGITAMAGNRSAYVAMFDEIDEGTAVFKCTNDPPVGTSEFLTYENLPSDHYLWLCREGGRLLRGDLPSR